MFAYIYFKLGWSTQDAWWWHVDPVSWVDNYAAKDRFVFGATGYGKTTFEATPTPPCFCKSGGSTSWTSPLCSELNTPFLPVPTVFLQRYAERRTCICSSNQYCPSTVACLPHQANNQAVRFLVFNNSCCRQHDKVSCLCICCIFHELYRRKRSLAQ